MEVILPCNALDTNESVNVVRECNNAYILLSDSDSDSIIVISDSESDGFESFESDDEAEGWEVTLPDGPIEDFSSKISQRIMSEVIGQVRQDGARDEEGSALIPQHNRLRNVGTDRWTNAEIEGLVSALANVLKRRHNGSVETCEPEVKRSRTDPDE